MACAFSGFSQHAGTHVPDSEVCLGWNTVSSVDTRKPTRSDVQLCGRRGLRDSGPHVITEREREGERRNVQQSDTATNSCRPSIKSGRVHAVPHVASVCLIPSLSFVS